MLKEINTKLLLQRQTIDENKIEMNENMKKRLEKQNEDIESIQLSLTRITNLMDMQTSNQTYNWRKQEHFNRQNLEALNQSNIELQFLLTLPNNLDEFQNETMNQIHNQLNQMTTMRNQLSALMNESAVATDSIEESIELNLRAYDAMTNDLKLHFANTEFRVLTLIQNESQGKDVNEDIMQEMDLLSLGKQMI